MSRAELALKATAFFAYLAVQIVFPATALFNPAYRENFTWRMFEGGPTTRFAVLRRDGSTEEIGNPLRARGRARLFSGSVDQVQFVPPYLCRRFPDVTHVVVRRTAEPERRLACPLE